MVFDSMKKKLLFICTYNSARSQIAEALVNQFYSKKYEAFSAGTKPTEINAYVVEVMGELGIDLSRNRTKMFPNFKELNSILW